MNTRALTAGEVTDGEIELFRTEQEARGPAGDVLRPVAEHNGVTAGGEGAAQGSRRVNALPVLFEVDDTEAFGATDFTTIHRDFTTNAADERGFAGAVGAEDAQTGTRSERKVEV